MMESLIFGYVLGSIPFGFLLSKIFLKTDLRTLGSGNIGATNVLRTGSKKLAAITLLLDGLKAFLAGYGAIYFFGADDVTASISAAVAVLGHIFPIWLKFKGGKGVASYLGFLFFMSWPIGALTTATWLLVAIIARISSLSALVALGLSISLSFYSGIATEILWLQTCLVLIIFYRHQDNIKRILNGSESKIRFKKS